MSEKCKYIDNSGQKKCKNNIGIGQKKCDIMNLNIESGVTITPEDTLIILDEIQKTPKVLESLNYFCEEAPEYHIVTACSLLGVAIHEGVSYPVGKVDLYSLEVKAETNIRSQSLKAYCDKFHPKKAVRFSTLKYMDQEWMENIPLYAVCNL